MKGILIAGGYGTRMYPVTISCSKHLLPVYDKPMIYYPLSILMLASIREVLIVTHEPEVAFYKTLLRDGSQWGLQIEYLVQPKAEGIAQSIVASETFIGRAPVCIVLGDNLLYGQSLSQMLKPLSMDADYKGATIFSKIVQHPEDYGVVAFDQNGQPIQIVEKPTQFLSNHAVIGLYFYDQQVVRIAKSLSQSLEKPLELTDINQYYLHHRQLRVEKLWPEITWMDMGSHQSLLEAANFVYRMEQLHEIKVGCLEEIAWRLGYIDNSLLKKESAKMSHSSYGKYLLSL